MFVNAPKIGRLFEKVPFPNAIYYISTLSQTDVFLHTFLFIDLLLTVVPEFIVASVRYEPAKADTKREEDLASGVNPHLHGNEAKINWCTQKRTTKMISKAGHQSLPPVPRVY